MSKSKTIFLCEECGESFKKWQGQCPECLTWNSLVETNNISYNENNNKLQSTKNNLNSYSGGIPQISTMDKIDLKEHFRFSTNILEFDRVLGGGIVQGSVTLVGGAPGIGKSSILLQVMAILSKSLKCLYITGEESLSQIALRAKRMDLNCPKLNLALETNIENILNIANIYKPKIMAIDSIQTMGVNYINSSSGGVSQIKESASLLTQWAKNNNCSIFLVGHVTKTGEVAGPKVLEHIVDSVIYLEGQNNSRYRIMRAIKNRFGAVNEIGVFAMMEKGLIGVKNPSAIFLNSVNDKISGSAILSVWEGTRPLLIEIQALVDNCAYGEPKRISLGIDKNRLAMLLAILNKHGNISILNKDIFINVVSGVKIIETSADLAIIASIVSSFYDIYLEKDCLFLGEIGLSGEIRAIPYGQERVLEASKHGFKKVFLPYGNNISESIIKNLTIKIIYVKNIMEAIKHIS